MSLVAYMLGARVVEKHFTLSHAAKGTDHAFSLMPEGMRKLVRDLERVPAAIGDGVKRPLPSEAKPLEKMGKKLVAARALPAGHVLAEGDLVAKSPADGGPAALRARRARRAGPACATSPRTRRSSPTMSRRPTSHPARAPPRRRDPAARRRAPRDRARRLRLRRRLHRQPRLGERDGRGVRRVLARRRDRPAPSGRGRRAVRDRLDRAEPRRRAAGREAGRTLHPRCRRQAGGRFARKPRPPASQLASVAYLGNDVNDATCLEAVGLPVVPADAWPEVVPLARWVLERPGGHGCVRELCDALCCALAPSVREVAPPVVYDRRRERPAVRPLRARCRRDGRDGAARGRALRRARGTGDAGRESSTSRPSHAPAPPDSGRVSTRERSERTPATSPTAGPSRRRSRSSRRTGACPTCS